MQITFRESLCMYLHGLNAISNTHSSSWWNSERISHKKVRKPIQYSIRSDFQWDFKNRVLTSMAKSRLVSRETRLNFARLVSRDLDARVSQKKFAQNWAKNYLK